MVRQRERDAAAAVMEADLSQAACNCLEIDSRLLHVVCEAVQNLNLERFEEKSRFAQQEQMLPEGKLHEPKYTGKKS